MSFSPATATEHEFTAACLFGGGGGMAVGSQNARHRFREHSGTYRLVAAYDFSEYACTVYEYLTGSKEEQLDATTITKEDILRITGGVCPDTVWLSAPCKGSSKLLSSAKAATEKYVAMNDLSYRGVLTLLDAFAGDEPPLLVFENVPNITTRARRMLADLRRLLRSRGYVIHDGYHEARHIGNLAQRRKRWFMVARLVRKVPVFLYKPRHQPGKVCRDVLEPLPLPNDPAGGKMHVLSDTSTMNLLRLWAIPAGGDWRDLIDDGRPRRARFRRHKVEKWDEPSVTIGGTGSNGPCGIADPRTEQTSLDLSRAGEVFRHVDRVTPWEEATGTVTSGGSTSNGAPAVADPRLELGRAKPGFTSTDHVLAWEDPSRTITGSTRPGNGAPSVADPRLNLLEGAPPSAEERRRWEREGVKTTGQTSWFNGKYTVTPWTEPAGTVIGAGAGNGGSYVSDPRVPDAHYGFDGALGVLGPDDVAHPVTGRAGPTTGPFSYADPQLPGAPRFKGSLGVLAGDEPAGTVTSEAAPSTGAFSYAAPVPPSLSPQAGNGEMHYGKYVVVPWGSSTKTVTTASRVGSGAQAVADPRVNLSTTESSFHQGAGPGRWGVLSPLDTSGTVTGNARTQTGPFSYAARAPTPINLVPSEDCYDAGYGVLSPDEPSRTVAATAAVGCGAYAIADDVPGPVDLALKRPQYKGTYGVQGFDEVSCTVTANVSIDCGTAAIADPRPTPAYVVLSYEETKRIVDGEVTVPFAIVDPAHPEEAMAIVDDLRRPPFRWVETRSKRGKVSRRRETVALVLISADKTWHRPLTTLELAVLQGLDWWHKGAPLDFGGGTTAQREVIGNMVPPPVAQAMGEQMILSLLVSRTVGFALGDPGTEIWVKNVRRLENELRREGYVVVKGRRPMNFTTGLPLDDGAMRWKSKGRKPKRKAAKRKAQASAAQLPMTQASAAMH